MVTLIIKKENFIYAYAAVEDSPIKNEVDYVLNNLDHAEYETDVEHASCSIYCECPEDEMDDIEVMHYSVHIPFDLENSEGERTINILLCKRCRHWAIQSE